MIILRGKSNQNYYRNSNKWITLILRVSSSQNIMTNLDIITFVFYHNKPHTNLNLTMLIVHMSI